MRRLLAIPNARLYLAGQTLSVFGDQALWIAMGVWVKTLTGSTSAAGLVWFAFTAPQFAAPLAGWLVDRVRRRPLLIVANLVLSAAVLPLLLVRGPGDIWLIYVVMLLYGAAYGVLGSGQTALLPAMLPDEVLPDANGALQTVREGIRLVGPLAGAGLFAWRGAAFVVVLDATTFLAAAASLIAIRVDEPAPARGEGHWRAEVAAGLQHVRRTPILLQMVVALALAMLFFGFAETLAYSVVTVGLHRPPTFVGPLLTVMGIGAIVGGVTAGPLLGRLPARLLFGLALILSAVTGLLLATPSLPLVMAGVIAAGLAVPWLLVSITTVLQRVTPSHLLGRASSAFDLLVGVPQTLSIALGAVLVALIDYRLLLVACAALTLAAAAYVLTRREQRAKLQGASLIP
jgi:MFS family permease